jgi:O-antigen/teichoic acid export membrane protein
VSVVGALDALVLVLLLRFWVTPAELGVATLAVSLYPALDRIAELGIPEAIMGKESSDSQVLSSVYWMGLLAASVLAGGLLLLGPYFGRQLGQPDAGSLLSAYSGKLLVQATWTVPIALMKKQLRFRELTMIRILSNLGDVTGKVVVAAAGHPVACFVVGQLGHAVIMAAAVRYYRPFRPRWVLHPRKALGHFRFGIATSASQILGEIYSNLDYQVIGRVFGETALGLYRVAYDLVLYCSHFIASIVVDVALPAFARMRHDPPALARQLLWFSRTTLWMVVPVVSFIALCAPELLFLFFPRCTEAATATRILCVVGVVRTLGTLFPPLLYGLGRPRVMLLYAAIATGVMAAAFELSATFWGPSIGFVAVAWSWAIAYPLLFGGLLRITLATIDISPGRYVVRLAMTGLATGVTLLPAVAMRLLSTSYAVPTRLVLIGGMVGLSALSWLAPSSPLRRRWLRWQGDGGTP